MLSGIAGGVVVAAIGAVVGGLYAAGVFTSSASGAVSVLVATDTATRLISPGGRVIVDVDAGSVEASSRLSYRSLSSTEIPVLPAQYKVTDTAFDLTLDGALLKPITITVRLSAADGDRAESDSANIVIQHYKEDGGGWTPLPTVADFGASTARAQVNSLSMFALTTRTPRPTPSPTDTPEPALTPTDTPEPALTPTDTPEPALTPTDTPEPALTPADTPEPALTPTDTPAPAVTPTYTPAPAVTPTDTSEPAVTPTDTPEPAVTPTDTPEPAVTPTDTPEPAVTPTDTPAPAVTPTYTLTTSARPSAGGSVSPSGVNTYDSGSSVTVTATPSAGYAFTSWTGSCSGTGSCSLTLNTNKTVTANFTLITYDLTTSASQGGSVSPPGTTTHNSGKQVTVMATPAAGYTFSGWSGACGGTGSCVVNMTADKSVGANFTLITYDLITSASQGGSVSPSGTTTHNSGSQVTVTATPAAGYTFSGWSGGWGGTGSCVVTMTADKSVGANFTLITYDLTTSASQGGSVSPFGTTTHNSGNQVTVTATPAAGYTFSGWTGACGGTGSCVVTMTADKSVGANFTLITYDLITSASQGGSVSPSGTTTHNSGSQVTVTATPAAGYTFSGWSGGCGGTGSCVVTMTADKSVGANFTLITYDLTTSASQGGSVSPSGTTTHNSGSQVTVTATPAAGYTFSSWSGDCSGSGGCTVTMNGDKSVTANFAPTPAPVGGKIDSLVTRPV